MIWHVVHTNANAERLAQRELDRAGYETLYLHRHVLVSHANRKIEVIRALFPRYLFIGRDERQGLMAANTCHGVSTVLHFGGQAETIPERFIADWRQRLSTIPPALDAEGNPCTVPGCLSRPGEKPKRTDLFKPGEHVVIVDGPLAGSGAMQCDGIVKVDKGTHVTIVLSMFRTALPVDVEPKWLRRLNPACGAVEAAREAAF